MSVRSRSLPGPEQRQRHGATVVRLSHTILVLSLDEICYSTTFSPPTETAVRFHSSTSSYVSITETYVSLPCYFRGPITIRTGDDRIALSPALKEHTALISDVPGVRVYFVGDRPRVGKWGNDGDNSDNGGAVEDSSLHGLSVSGKVFDRANQLGWRGRGASYDAQWLARVLWRC